MVINAPNKFEKIVMVMINAPIKFEKIVMVMINAPIKFEKTVMVMIIVSIREERGEKIRGKNKRPGMEIGKTRNEPQENWKEKDVVLLIA